MLKAYLAFAASVVLGTSSLVIGLAEDAAHSTGLVAYVVWLAAILSFVLAAKLKRFPFDHDWTSRSRAAAFIWFLSVGFSGSLSMNMLLDHYPFYWSIWAVAPWLSLGWLLTKYQPGMSDGLFPYTYDASLERFVRKENDQDCSSMDKDTRK
jgi:hypothetical protein